MEYAFLRHRHQASHFKDGSRHISPLFFYLDLTSSGMDIFRLANFVNLNEKFLTSKFIEWINLQSPR